MRWQKRLLWVIALIVLAALTGTASLKASEASAGQEKLVVFESVGSTT